MKTKNILMCAPTCELEELNNLFIELTEKNCNQHCKQCYIKFPIQKNIKDFIQTDKIKEILKQSENEKLNCIYLTGAEPMTHPDFNNILRLCLKRTNVCICTNGSFINEKKARFLKKVENESEYSILFELPLSHYNEIKNDDVRSRGSYRQIMHAVKNLNKYDFFIVLCITNYYKESKKQILNEFIQIFENMNIKISDKNIKINEFYEKKEVLSDFDFQTDNLDCKNSRILTSKGLYTCPFLANDYRGRVGNDLNNYSKKILIETNFCVTCVKNKEQMFAINKNLFE